MKRLILLMILIVLPVVTDGYDATPRCFKQLETSFFDKTALSATFDIHLVNTGAWGLIFRDLKLKSQRVPKMIAAEAKKQKKNPFEHPFSPKEAEKILLQVLYSIFRETLISFDVTSESDIQEMFSYLKQQQDSRLKSCLESKGR